MKNVNLSTDLILICKKLIKKNPFISMLQLNKKLYFIQAAFLVEFSREAFPEDFYAWMSGPVVKKLSKEYINTNALKEHLSKITINEKLDETLDELIDIIFDEFRKDSDIDLVNRTRAYSSWVNNYVKIDKKISKDDIIKCHLKIKKEEGLLL